MLTRRIFRLNFWNSKIMELSDLFFRLTNRFRITYSLKILSKSNHSSKHNSFQSRHMFPLLVTFYESLYHPKFHQKPSINPFQSPPPTPLPFDTNLFPTQFERSHNWNPSRVTFFIKKEKRKKKNHSIHPIYPYPTPGR